MSTRWNPTIDVGDGQVRIPSPPVGTVARVLGALAVVLLVWTSYYQVGAGGTGHAEAVRVYYDPAKLSYAQLVDYFWRHIDPTAKDRQFCDAGSEYRSAIFWQDENQRKTAEASRDALLQSGRFPAIHTEIAPASSFYRAEEYHQDYYKKNPLRYAYYRNACGRDARVAQLWGSK